MSVFSPCLPLLFHLYTFLKRSVYLWIYYLRTSTNLLFLSNFNPCLAKEKTFFFFPITMLFLCSHDNLHLCFSFTCFIFWDFVIDTVASWLLTRAVTHSPFDSPVSQSISGGKKKIDRLKTVFTLTLLWQLCTWIVQKGVNGEFSADYRWARVKLCSLKASWTFPVPVCDTVLPHE